MKVKYFALLLLILSTAFLGLTGCGNNYDNLQVLVSTNQVAVFEDENAGETSAIITASVEGATEDMLKEVDFWFKDNDVAKAEVISLENNVSTIKITANGAGTTIMRVISREYSKVYSEDINISVYRDAESMAFRDQKPALLAGSNLKLETGSLISFTPARVYPNQAIFSMMTPENPLWNDSYGSFALTGVYIENNILYADENAECGIAQIEAKMSNNISCAVYVMIYKNINETDFELFDGANKVDYLTLAVNSDELNSAHLSAKVNAGGQNFVIRPTVLDDILVPTTPNAQGDFDVSVMDSGLTKLIINVDLINPVTGEIYITFSKSYDVEIVRIAKQVVISSPTVSASSEPVTMYVQDYYENIRGTETHVLVTPQEAKDHSYEIQVIEIDDSADSIDDKKDSLLIFVSGKSYVKQKDYIGYQPYIYGELLKSDTSFFVALNGDKILNKVKLSIQANTYNDALPVVSNEVTYIVQAGVREITTSVDVLETSVNNAVNFSVNFTTSKGDNIGNQKFTFEFKDNSLAKIATSNTAYNYILTGVKDGTTELTIRAESGVFIVVTVKVYLTPTEFYLTTDRMYENSNIAEEVWNANDYIDDVDGLLDKGVTHLTIKQNSILTVSCVYNPVGNSNDNVQVLLSTRDANGTYISLSELSADNKFKFYANKATPQDEPVEIIVKFYFKQFIDNNWQQIEGTRILYVTIYKPLTVYYWSGTNNQKNITTQLYDKNSLNVDRQGLSSASLSTFINTDATVFRNGGTIEWTAENPNILSIVSNGTNAILTASLDPDLYTLNRYETYVYASVTEYGKQSTLTCKVIIIKPQLVESITVTNYKQSDGIRLNDLGTQSRTKFTLNTVITPKNPYDSRLGYKIYNAEYGEGSIPVATTPYQGSAEDAVIILDENNPNIIIAKNAGLAVVRIYPLDRINTIETELNPEWYIDVWVIVENGSVTNPYSIYTAEEFLAIGSSAEALTKNYVLMQTIDISRYSNQLPIGKEFGANFSGSLDTYRYGINTKSSVLGIKTNNTTITDTEVLGGLFGRISGTISNINFNFTDTRIDLTNVLAQIINEDLSIRNIYLGLLAGVVDGNEIDNSLINVEVKLNNFENRTIYVLGLNDSEYTVYFGGIAGQVNGNLTEVYTNISVQLDLGETKTIVGGLAGEFNGAKLGQNNTTLSKSHITILRDNVIDDNSAVGGLIGVVSKDSTIYSQKVVGSIVATASNNVGGLIGINYGILGLFENNIEYTVLAGVKVQGFKNVGGLVGLNYGLDGNLGIINYARAENYEQENVSPLNQSLACGIENAGGLVGQSLGGRIAYSYAMSYVKQLNMTQYGTGNYYGDVVGVNNIGGFVGFAKNVYISSCFAKTNIQTYFDSAYSNCIGGGFAGYYEIEGNVSLASNIILNSYSNGRILTNNSNVNETGELIGYLNIPASNNAYYIDTCYAHVIISNISSGLEVLGRNLIGTNVNNKNVTKCYYLADVTDINTGAVTESDMTVNSSLGDFDTTKAYIGWSFGDKDSNSAWVQYAPSQNMVGINDNLPILYDANRGWLYNEAITDIQISALSYKDENKSLPTYFEFNGAGCVASVVVLDNIEPVISGDYIERSLYIYNTIENKGLFNINVFPEIAPDKWSISVRSSDYSIAEIVQDDLTLLGAKIIFKKSGLVTITFQSLLDSSEKQEVKICVINGFSNFDILDENDNSLTLDGQNQITIKNGYGKVLYPHFINLNGYSDNCGIKYETVSADYFDFVNYNFNAGVTFIPSNISNLLGAKQATNYQEVFASPYIELDFGVGNKYNYTFSELKKNFYVKVYNGISSASFNAKDAQINSSEDLMLTLKVVTDNTVTTIIDTPIVYKNGAQTPIQDNSEVLSILPLDPSENITDELITVNYLLQLSDNNKAINENVSYKIFVNILDESGLYTTLVFDLKFTPAPIVRIDISHYTYGLESMESGEVSSNLISPGTKGLLKIETTPSYAYYDYMLISSTQDATTGQSVQLLQVINNNGVYKTIEAQYANNGALIAKKITGIDSLGKEYFTGIIYIITLVGGNLVEGTNFTITAIAMNNNDSDYAFPPTTYNLITTFAPYANLSLDNSNGDTVARGTVANFHLTGVLYNSDITILNADYGMSADLSQNQLCAFGNIKTKFGQGQKENVDLIIPFYVGILANPNNSKITITLQIDSTTPSGGLLNPLILQYTIYIVDYQVESVYTNDAENGVLNASIRTYKTMQAKWILNEPSLINFEKYIGGNELDIANFNIAKNKILESAEAKLKIINEQGDGQGGIWWYNNGTGYTLVQSAYSYPDFIISYTTMNDGNSYYIIKGKTLTSNLNFMLQFKGFYVYDSDKNSFVFTIESELSSVAQGNILNSYQNIFEQIFNVNIINNTTDDTPDIVDSVEKFRSMTDGASYMLTTDLVLDNWTPISTAITSLDGNGHIIYLRSFATNTKDSVNYGLFDTLQSGTVLKNLIIDVSYNIFIDLQNASNVNFGFIAGVNDGGSIYNCDVVVTQSKENWTTIYNNTNRTYSNNSNFAFANSIFNQMLQGSEQYQNNNTLASSFILTDKSSTNRLVTTYIGGIVGQNNGYITNCRVGRIDNNILGSDRVNKKYALQGINLFASGNVGGLAGKNSGVIANSYFANGMVVNYSMSIFSQANQNGAKTGGLVAEQTNTGRIQSSFAVGQLQEDIAQAKLGGIKAYGTIGGLVHSNAGSIINSYANMPLSSSNAMGGFVYQNTGKAIIKYSYSMSKINSSGLINGVFVGVDQEGNVLNGVDCVVEKCYYFSTENNFVDAKEPATALSALDWSNAQGVAFDGFAITDNNSSTWYIDTNKTYLGPQLRFASYVYYSHRNVEYAYDSDCELGSEINPIIISSLKDWQNVFNYSDISGTIRSAFMQANDDYVTGSAKYIFGNYYINLIADIDFNESMHETSYDTIFKGKLFGNGYKISGLNYRQTSSISTTKKDFGLFNTINNSSISNLILEIANEITVRARHVGVLAGTINDSYVENIVLQGQTLNSAITGLNMVGALSGLVIGDSEIRNIETSISVNAISAKSSSSLYSYYYRSALNVSESEFSYAGGILGIVDLEKEENSEQNPRIQNLTTRGNANIYGEISGGIIGLLDSTSEVKQVEFIIDADDDIAPKIRGSNFAGGLIGENRGQILNSRIGLEINKQIEQDSNILTTDLTKNYIGYTDLFTSEEQSTAVGGLVGLNVGGWINNSYSRVAVISNNSYVVGGIIGLAINAPNSFVPADNDATLLYLRNLSNIENIYNDNGKSYNLEDSKIKTHGAFSFSATLKEVYTTGALNGGKIIGGVVGACIGSPMFANSTETLVAGINNYNELDRTFTSKLNNSNYYVGGLVGYLGYNVSANNEGIIPIVSSVEISGEYSLGNASQKSKVVGSVNGVIIPVIGNVLNPNHTVSNVDFMTVANSSDDRTFDGFNETIWSLDKSKTSHRFPILKSSYSATVSNIETAQQFFEFLNNTNVNSYGKIVVDNLVITGTDWINYVVDSSNSKYTIAPNIDDAVTGRLEGAVPYEINGQTTTKSATVILKDFTETQSKAFDSLFGYTQKLRVVNINFVFDFTPNLANNGIEHTKNTITSFGLLAQESYSTYFENISVVLNNDNILKINNLENVGLVTGFAQSCNFTNVEAIGTIQTIDNYASTSSLNLGSMFGLGKVTNTISGTRFGELVVKYNSNNNYTLNIGGLVGQADGILNIKGILISNQNNLNIDFTITANSNTNVLNIAGIVANVTGTSKLQNFKVSGNINITRLNGQDNSISNIGGVAGIIKNTNISSITSLVNINSNINNGNIYAGGIAGQIVNEQEFTGIGTSMQFSGFSTEFATNLGNITLNATTNNNLYIGGIFGLAENDLILSSIKVVPSGQARLIYNALYNSGILKVDSATNRIYAGGLIGNAKQGRLQSGIGYTELEKPNNILKISDSAFTGEVIINNNQSSNSYNYLGGLIGFTQLAISDCLSAGIVSFDANSTISVYAGGIAGITNNDITYSITITSVQARLQSVSNISAIGAICGLQENDNARIVYTYYSADYAGLLDNFGTNLTAMQMLNVDSFKVNNVQILSEEKWTFATDIDINGVTKQISLLYPKAIENEIDTSYGGYITPCLIDDFDMLAGQMLDDTNSNKIIIFNTSNISISQIPNLEINNVRKIIGNGVNILVTPYNFTGSMIQNIGLFKEIPKNIVVSGIIFDFSEIKFRTNSNVNIGGITGINNGAIYNCVVGTLEKHTPKMNYASDFVDLKTKYENNFEGITENGNSMFKIELTGSSQANIGAIAGINNGCIYGSLVVADLSVLNTSLGEINIGGIAGKMQNAWLSNSISQGRVIVSKVTDTTKVGGIVGLGSTSRVDAVLANANVTTFTINNNNVGFAFGAFDGISNGVIVNKDISGNLSESQSNNLFNYALSTNELLTASKFNTIIKNKDNQYLNIWNFGNITNNYGYPYLNITQNIDFNTGDGSASSPYQIKEGSELNRTTVSSATGKHFVLVKDVMISSSNLETTAKATIYAQSLRGASHVVLIDKFIEPSSSGGTLNIGLFKNITERTEVNGLGVVFNAFAINNPATINFGGLASENKGTISNCCMVALGEINLTSLASSRIGGLVGQNSGGILNSWADVDFNVKDGFIGGLVGLLGKSNSVNSESTAYIKNCFANGDITAIQDTSKSSYMQTSIGGLIGLANASLTSGRSIENCYAYGNSIQVASMGSYVGALIGNAVKFDTYRTYAYVYTPGRTETSKLGYGNYENLAMTGNVIEGAYDNTSVIAVWLGVNQGEIGNRRDIQDLCPVASVSTMRNTAIGSGCYLEWIVSSWTRSMGVGSLNEYLLYLNNVTPIDKQENDPSDLNAEQIFNY